MLKRRSGSLGDACLFLQLHTVQVIVLVCHYKRTALPPYNGFPADMLTVH